MSEGVGQPKCLLNALRQSASLPAVHHLLSMASVDSASLTFDFLALR